MCQSVFRVCGPQVIVCVCVCVLVCIVDRQLVGDEVYGVVKLTSRNKKCLKF